MPAKSFSEVRRHLSEVMDEVCDSRAPLIITRHGKPPVVMLSLEEWEGLEETLRLLSSRANAERLRDAIAAADRGELIERELID
jgi:antitoxin YefM